MWIVTAGQGALLALSGCQQGHGAWISGPVSASETSLPFKNRFPDPPRAAGRRDGFIIVDCATRGTAPGTGRSSDW
jgi:hypothetical protein